MNNEQSEGVFFVETSVSELISLVVPCYNEQTTIPFFIEEILKLKKVAGCETLEVVFVNDGSTDDTLSVIRKCRADHAFVRYVSLSRNFGKEGAILAGLRAARGKWVAVMDADLQDPPMLLPEMLKAVRDEAYDCVGTRRVNRAGEPVLRSLFARAFYRLINSLSEVKLVDGARDYKLLSRRAVDALVSLPENNRFSKGLYEWVGFRTKWIEFENVERVSGETKWSFWKLFKYAVEGIASFSAAPLLVSVFLGMLLSFASFIAILFLCIRQMLYHASVNGWTSMVCIIIFLSGMQLFFIGILGLYLSKVYAEVKKRPAYIVAEES